MNLLRPALMTCLFVACLGIFTARLPAAEHTKDSLDTVKKGIADSKATEETEEAERLLFERRCMLHHLLRRQVD